MTKALLTLWGACGLGFLSAQNADSLQALPDAKGVFAQFSTMINWFIYALLLISVISAIRMYFIKKRNDKGENPRQNPIPGDTKAPIPKSRKSAFSLPLVIMLILLSVILFNTFNKIIR